MKSGLVFFKEVFDSWLIVVGAVLTILPFFQSWIEKKLKKEINLRYLWIMGGACLVLSFYLAWLEQYNANQVTIEEKNQLSSQKAALDAAIIEANNRIEDLRRQNEELLQRQPLSVQIEPPQRRIRDRVRFVELLKRFPSGRIKISSPVSDAEAQRFALDFVEALRDAAWTVDGTTIGLVMHNPPLIGIRIRGRTQGVLRTQSVMILREALILLDIAPRTEVDSELPDDVVVLRIGFRPN